MNRYHARITSELWNQSERGPHSAQRRNLAIVLDNRITIAPQVMERILGGTVRITMGTAEPLEKILSEANELATVLRTGTLESPWTIVATTALD